MDICGGITLRVQTLADVQGSSAPGLVCAPRPSLIDLLAHSLSRSQPFSPLGVCACCVLSLEALENLSSLPGLRRALPVGASCFMQRWES